jgi:hypothetical protein
MDSTVFMDEKLESLLNDSSYQSASRPGHGSSMAALFVTKHSRLLASGRS